MFDRLIFSRPRARRVLPAGPFADRVGTEELRLPRPDGAVLQGWVAQPLVPHTPTRVLLYFGGRREDVCWSPTMASHFAGWTVYAFNYRGFGGSTGRSGESVAKADALAIHAHIAERHRGEVQEWALMGRSLGTALAIWLARHVAPQRLVLLSPFCSVSTVLGARAWLQPVALCVRGKFQSIALAPDIRARTLILLAEKDAQITHAESVRLGRSIPSPVTLTVVPQTNHQSLPRHARTQALLCTFFASCGAS